MSKKTRKAIKRLTEAVEDLQEQNEDLSRKLTEALEHQSEELQALTRTLEARADTQETVPEDDVEQEPEATEAAERRAKELGVDLSGVKGTGTEGRILVKDVEETVEAED